MHIRNPSTHRGIKFAIARRLGHIEWVYDNHEFQGLRELQIAYALNVVDVLIEHFAPVSVIDVGCGPGGYLAEFFKRGVVEITGIEGSQAVIPYLMIPTDVFRIHDLAQPLSLPRKYDLCVCMEVAEHLPSSAARTLVASLVQASDTIFFTAAVPGQGGHDHVNEQPHEYWIALFESHGYAYDRSLSDQIRKQMLERGVIEYIPRNTMIFRGASAVEGKR